MKKIIYLIAVFIGLVLNPASYIYAQGLGVNSSGNAPDPSAMIDVSSTTKGALIPRLTTAQRNAITLPAAGLIIYNLDCGNLNVFNGSGWVPVFTGNGNLPGTAGAISGTAGVCANQNAVSYSISAIPNATGYVWTYTGTGFSIATGSNTNAITANFSAGTTSGNLTVHGINDCGSGIASAAFPITLLNPPAAPTTGAHGLSAAQIVWNWNTVPGATGYKYSTVNDYGSATNNGASTSYTQAGLTCNTSYTLYLWAYNSCGNSSSIAITATTSSCCPSGIINTIAGTGTAGFSGDGGAATGAQLNLPREVAFDGLGNVYIADGDNHRIRKITISTGLISTIAGNGTAGFSGDGGAATSAQLNNPWGVAADAAGNVYIADFSNNRIRKVTASTGFISTIAGTGSPGFSGDGGAATGAQLNNPYGLALDGSGNVYIGDRSNHRVRKVTVSTGIITTIAGIGTAGFSGDGGAAISAQLNMPHGLALDGSGNVYISEFQNHTIRKVTVSTGIISTFAGTGIGGYNGDGIAATSAQLSGPPGVALDGSGNVYIADFNNQRIRKVTISTGLISTIAGTGTAGYNGDGISATGAQLNNPPGVSVDAFGDVYIPDYGNNRIRKVCH